MATWLFRSPLAHRLQAFLETRRAGNGDRDPGRQKILFYLDRFFLAELKPGQPLTREIAERFNESMAHLSTGTRINRMSVLRQFCMYLSHFDPRTCVIYRSYLPRRSRPAPYIYTRKEVQKIMAAARKLGPPGTLRPIVVSTLTGLLYATGIRIGEALNLTLGDIDLRHRLIEIRQGKFNKSRYVPLSLSTTKQMRAYLEHRRRAGFSTVPRAYVFLSMTGKKHAYPSFTTVFLEIVRGLGIRRPKGERGPRIHDLRHTFAVNRLLAWYRQGVNLGAKLPLLSTYLGHSTVTGTEVYLHATAELLQSAGQRFHAHFAVPPVRFTKRYDKD
jgi:integrase/recombinase XerD